MTMMGTSCASDGRRRELQRVAHRLAVIILATVLLLVAFAAAELAYELGGITGVGALAAVAATAALLRHPLPVSLVCIALIAWVTAANMGDGPGPADRAYRALAAAAQTTLVSPPDEREGSGIVTADSDLRRVGQA